ncbi:MAG: TetR/AcrR family transcriptional regulator [Alicyclobacillus sp.]|nr:TetR/AcrR family transcriptional regulator [Alicyclobacillus sp.]
MRTAMTRDERHAHILHVARALFAERGYEDVRIADVIAASNIARGTFYLHFDSMESLLMAVFDDVVEEVWAEIGPILERVEDLEACTAQTVHAVLTMFHRETNPLAEVFFSGGGAAFQKRREEALYEKFGALMERALAIRHHIPLDGSRPEDEKRLRWTVVTLITLVANMAHYAAEAVPDEETEAFERQLVKFVLAGIQAHFAAVS